MDPAADGGVAEPAEHRREAARLDPEREQVPEWIRGAGVRVGVAVHLNAPATRGVDLREELPGAAPIVEAGELHVDDLDVHP